MYFTENLETAMNYLHKHGAFLTVKEDSKVNTMTISWGNIGFEWNRPIFTVLIRKSRYTHGIIENNREFTVSIPTDDKLKTALSFCGTKSGRAYDKIKECNLTLSNGKKITTPIIADCHIHFECRVVYKHEMDREFIDSGIMDSYADNDYHTFYYGEIIDCYRS